MLHDSSVNKVTVDNQDSISGGTVIFLLVITN